MSKYNLRKRKRPSSKDKQLLNDADKSEDSENQRSLSSDNDLEDQQSSESSESSENNFIVEEDEYFEMFVDNIYTKLEKFKVPKDMLTDILKTNIFKLYNLVSDYDSMSNSNELDSDSMSDSMSNSNEWKKKLSKEEVEKLEPRFNKIRKIIKDEEPTIAKILDSKLTDDEMKNCMQMYYNMIYMEMGTNEFYNARKTLINILERSKNNSSEMSDLESRLQEKFKDKKTLKESILNLNASEEILNVLYSKYLKWQELQITDTEYATLKNQIEWATSLPYNNVIENRETDKNKFFIKIQSILDRKLYGLSVVKQKLLLLLNNSITSPNARKAIALCGPPGTGKSVIAKAFAEAVGLPFDRISLGGARDITLFYVSDNVYIGAGPGIIIRILKKMKYSNGVVLLDEIDKLQDMEMQYALLHITDFVQNGMFRDKFLSDIDIDISRLWFFYSMNSVDSLDKALKDRLLPIINIPSYTFKEKVSITKDYVLPEELLNIGLGEKDILLTDKSAEQIVIKNPEGIRSIKMMIQDIVSKINLCKSLNNNFRGITVTFKIHTYNFPVTISDDILQDLLADFTYENTLGYFS